MIVEASCPGGTINRGLIGIHSYPVVREVARARETGLPIAYFRGVVSQGDGFRYDCATETIEPESLERYHAWLDAVHQVGAEPILALSYVPTCMTEAGHPKSPPNDPAAYDRYLDAVLRTFVSERIDAGKKPLRYLEAWNEPDLPLDLGRDITHGHGFLGNIDEYVETIFLPLGRAVVAEEARSGIDIRFGGASSFFGRSFREVTPDLEFYYVELLGLNPVIAAVLAWLAEIVLEPFGGVDALLDAGGVRWPDRLVAEAAEAGFESEVVSWHHYENYPLLGDGEQSLPPPFENFAVVFEGRNPLANPVHYRDDPLRYRERYPGKELIVTEWRMSAGNESRHNTYDEAAFIAANHAAMRQGGLDGALYLGVPEGPPLYAFRMIERLGERGVPLTLAGPSEETGIWAEAGTEGPGHLALMLSQWHALAEDAPRQGLSVAITGLQPGRYSVSEYRIDKDHAGSNEADEFLEVMVSRGGLALLNVTLDGQAVVFLELRQVGG